jgi:hypothetical protein
LLYSFQQTTKPYHDKDNNASTQDDIAELAKRTTHTQEEIDWILKSPERKNILRSLDPQLLALFHESNSPYAKKNTPQKASSASSTKKSRPLIQQAPKYDIAELAKRTTHTQEEMLWVLNSSKRRGILKELAPELIATFKTLCNDK